MKCAVYNATVAGLNVWLRHAHRETERERESHPHFICSFCRTGSGFRIIHLEKLSAHTRIKIYSFDALLRLYFSPFECTVPCFPFVLCAARDSVMVVVVVATIYQHGIV